MTSKNIRIFISQPLDSDAQIRITLSQHHYLSRVMRCKPLDHISLFNGTDGEWLSVIDSINKKETYLTAKRLLRAQYADHQICLAFSPIKNISSSFIIQKATELGVTKIYPIATERTIVRKVSLEKLKLVAIEAAEQSERLSVPEIHDISSLEDFLQNHGRSFNIILCDATGGENTPKECISQLKTNNNVIIIGPEGGFTQSELMHIKSFSTNVNSISFGKHIMRSETAIIAALAIYQALSGNWAT